MIRPCLIFLAPFLFSINAKAQSMVEAANRFIHLLDTSQKSTALYPFDSDERFSYHYFPINDRKGIPLDQLNKDQLEAGKALLSACISESAAKKVDEIISLEVILKALENRQPEDHFRDPGKYYLAIFGIPGKNTIWGWRFEGHHVSFHFSARHNKLVSGTPAFLGANPAVVQDGPEKGKQVLKDETVMGLDFLHQLTPEQQKKTIVSSDAPGEILTGINRKARIDEKQGISYSELSELQRQRLLQLINLYVHRFTKLFAEDMLKEIQKAGLEKVFFAWAGFTEQGIGKPHYYRIQGPTFIIEYDNTQNNANHVHTVVRDLQHDFGGDLLLEHYKAGHGEQLKSKK